MTTKGRDGTNITLVLAESDVEKDLGVTIDNKLSFKQHVTNCTNKANKILGIIRRSFDHLTEKMFVQLYKALVRPILEYGHAVWQPQHKNLCSDLEAVQRRATKLLAHLRDKPYPERLRVLQLPTLEHRRQRGDLIEVYKYLNGVYKVDSPGLQLADPGTMDLRGNARKLQKIRTGLAVRSNFFANRVVNNWNELPDSVVTSPTLNTFKSRLDKFWKDKLDIYSPACQNFC